MPLDAGNSSHYVLGPILAVVMVALLASLSKWAFSSGRRTTRTPDRTTGPVDHGLLRAVVEFPDRPPALAFRAVLSDAGIRSTLGVRRDGRVQVLVFPDDEDRARRLVPPGDQVRG